MAVKRGGGGCRKKVRCHNELNGATSNSDDMFMNGNSSSSLVNLLVFNRYNAMELHIKCGLLHSSQPQEVRRGDLCNAHAHTHKYIG